MASRGYATDLSDEEWNLIAPHIPPPKPGGPPPSTDMRRVVDAILYLLRTGCQWRLLPADFPLWGTDWSCFRRWRIDGVMDAHASGAVARGSGKGRARRLSKCGDHGQPIGEDHRKGGVRGYDGHKLVKGRKR